MAFIESSKNRVWTLPPDIRDLITSDHICYLIESFVDMTDFSEFEIRYTVLDTLPIILAYCARF